VGESQAEEMLGDLTARGRDPEIGITVHEATITLRIVAHGVTEEECRAKIEAARAAIRARMGTLVFGEEEDELEHVLFRMLGERGLSVASIEVGTKGLLVRRAADVRGHEGVYRGGVAAPALAALEAGGGSSLVEAAQRWRRQFAADFCLAVGEFPPYDPEHTQSSAPQAQIGLVGENVSRVVDYTFLGDPVLNTSRAVKVAFNLLRLHLLRGDHPQR
jgi:nicotinamide-nucleotide amidase